MRIAILYQRAAGDDFAFNALKPAAESLIANRTAGTRHCANPDRPQLDTLQRPSELRPE
jgi:hypothetical protein